MVSNAHVRQLTVCLKFNPVFANYFHTINFISTFTYFYYANLHLLKHLHSKAGVQCSSVTCLAK